MKRFSIFGMEVVPAWAASAYANTHGVHVEFFTGPDGEQGNVSLTLSDEAAERLLNQLRQAVLAREAR